jgi:ABC-type uncharacterized transport system fused permease/ATPase subunit
VIDEVLDFVDADSRDLVTQVLAKRMKDSTIIHIGRQLPHDKAFRGAVHLVSDTTVRKMPRRKSRQHGKSAPRAASGTKRS